MMSLASYYFSLAGSQVRKSTSWMGDTNRELVIPSNMDSACIHANRVTERATSSGTFHDFAHLGPPPRWSAAADRTS